MEALIVGAIIIGIFIYNGTIDKKKFMIDNEKYLQAFREEDYTFLVFAKYVEENQPLAVVCGHIHEGVGMEKIGETLVINPGSLGEAGSYAQMEIEKEGEFWQIKDAKICKL